MVFDKKERNSFLRVSISSRPVPRPKATGTIAPRRTKGVSIVASNQRNRKMRRHTLPSWWISNPWKFPPPRGKEAANKNGGMNGVYMCMYMYSWKTVTRPYWKESKKFHRKGGWILVTNNLDSYLFRGYNLDPLFSDLLLHCISLYFQKKRLWDDENRENGIIQMNKRWRGFFLSFNSYYVLGGCSYRSNFKLVCANFKNWATCVSISSFPIHVYCDKDKYFFLV